jgi:hypothetical protein
MVVKADCADTNYLIPINKNDGTQMYTHACQNDNINQNRPVYIIVHDFEAVAANKKVQIDLADIQMKAAPAQANDFAHIAIRW